MLSYVGSMMSRYPSNSPETASIAKGASGRDSPVSTSTSGAAATASASRQYQQTYQLPYEAQSNNSSDQQNYPVPLNMGDMTASLPNIQSTPRQGPGYPYQPRPDIQPVAYYPAYVPGGNAQLRQFYVPQGYGQYQPQWMLGQQSPRYVQVPAPYVQPVSGQFPHVQPGPAIYHGRGAPTTLYQHAQYSDPQQLIPVSSTGSNQSVSQTSSAHPELSLQTTPRGPPRKPRQSGHALWVGNLPQGATVFDLKDHFSQGAKNNIESVKLISKSNCAFVNYRTHEACAAAMDRFHDSKFNGTRLVCRLRRTLPPSSSTTAAAESSSAPLTAGSEGTDPEEETGNMARSPVNIHVTADVSSRRGLRDRFFVMKSLTLHDLEISTRTGLWATQAHNEDSLNEAYETSENVFLFFSANKSGEYFGYARMASPISAKTGLSSDGAEIDARIQAAKVGSGSVADRPLVASTEVSPKAIITPETESAPRGRIIDDMARGTIFWEADLSDEDDGSGALSKSSEDIKSSDRATALDGNVQGEFSGGNSEENDGSENEDNPQSARLKQATTSYNTGSRGPAIAVSTPTALVGSRNSGSKPVQLESRAASASASSSSSQQDTVGTNNGSTFRVEWSSARKLPFYKCRGLRNPWNANREVKIARDGTEIETTVGKRLMAMFGSQYLPFQQA